MNASRRLAMRLAAVAAAAAGIAAAQNPVDPEGATYRAACAARGITDSECVGRVIWFRATGGNERFYAYTFPQRVGVSVDWYRVLRSDRRGERFRTWGIINDPSCCTPGSAGCPARSREQTYGFDWCPGDDELLRYVGRTGYTDPACHLEDAAADRDDPHVRGGRDRRDSPCELRFGTSTGALGFRKFPNPRFDAARWKALNGSLATWEGYTQRPLKAKQSIPSDARVSRMLDASIEPPFLIGTTCGSCHVAFDPTRPPADPEAPRWENIHGLIGNQYSRMAELLASGMPRSSLEWQMFAHPRPGVMDTSAIPHDQIGNGGTVNALINSAQRPLFTGRAITKWRKVEACGAGEDESACWCQPDKPGKCWRRSTRRDDTITTNVAGVRQVKQGVHTLLKGGEDSIGALEAIQRVYVNIGSCGEQCWVNHFADMRQLDPKQRGFGQTPFDIGQCRRDCPSFRALEDRLQNVFDFFLSREGEAVDLHVARDKERKARDPRAPDYTRERLVADLEREFGSGSVARGRDVFASRCARCHSSVPQNRRGPLDFFRGPPDFHAVADSHPRRIRLDFLGSDEMIPASRIGTYRCRALHSNHMEGALYEEYASAELRDRPVVADLRESTRGGRGYYRVPSLLNVWATAPFMHNNAIGPELCARMPPAGDEFFRARYVGADGLPLEQQPACFPFDPSVEGRYQLFKRSMHDLLHPDERGLKSTLTDAEIVLDLGIRRWKDGQEVAAPAFKLTIPRDIHSNFLAGFLHKQFARDVYDAWHNPGLLAERGKAALLEELRKIAAELREQPREFVPVLMRRRELLREHYWSCLEDIDNGGHRFGERLPEEDKKALTAFLATL